jgi:small-conductance mechanosensitive channel
MATAELGIPLGSFWGENHAWISAVISLLVAVAIATALDRAFRTRIVAERLHDELPLSREADTRLRFVRRLIYATILLIGVAVALSQFTGVNRLAGSLLASGAIAAAVLGFAARQTLANLVAGVMLAVTQPLRIGDWVTIEGNTGAVEDVRLNYTVLRTPGDQRIMIPNERLAGGILRNDTLTVDRVVLDVSVWIQPDADADRAIQELEDETGQTVTVAEAVPWGVRLAVGADPVPPADKGTAEAELRARCLRRLRGAGLLPAGGTAGRL